MWNIRFAHVQLMKTDKLYQNIMLKTTQTHPYFHKYQYMQWKLKRQNK